MLRQIFLGLLVLGNALALPYIPTTILTAANDTNLVYVFQPSSDSTSVSLVTVNASSSITPNSPVTTVSAALSFLSDKDNVAFIPFVDDTGDVYALAGQCVQGAQDTTLWTLKGGQDQESGNWVEVTLKRSEFEGDSANSGGVNYLAPGFTFSSPPHNTPSLYTFGGMCPNATILALDADEWQGSANYSNTLLSVVPQGLLSSSSFASVAAKDDMFGLSPVTASRGPPIPEAGFSATGLMPLVDGPNKTNVQQNFVLIGGQTSEAFINTSQLALLSLPEQSWSFIPILDPEQVSGELIRRDAQIVEPRSGHTAVLSEDGSKIIVFGGWVGDTGTPAEPQLAILEVGAGFGGSGDWQWSIPSVRGTGFTGNGLYGHGATMLAGNVMMIAGGTTIAGKGSQKVKRDAMGVHFFNITSNSWTTAYQNPDAAQTPIEIQHDTFGLNTGSKIGIGVGLGVGIPLFLLLLVCVVCLRRRQRRKDRRRSDLIDRAINGSDLDTNAQPQDIHGSPHSMVETGGSENEFPYPQALHSRQNSDGQESGWRSMRSMEAERTGLLVEIPSPTRGLRRGHHSRGSSHGFESSSRKSGQFPVIDEIDEIEQPVPIEASSGAPFELPELDLGAEFAAPKSPPPQAESQSISAARPRPLSDPFADPVLSMPTHFDSAPTSLAPTPNESPQRNSKGWIEDWEVVQAGIQSRDTAAQRSSGTIASQHLHVERVSPLSNRDDDRSLNNSDRTRSNMSEKSMHSAVSFVSSRSGKSISSINRNVSQRSANMFSATPQRFTRKTPRGSLPQAGTVSSAVAAIESTPPSQKDSPPGGSPIQQDRSVALSPRTPQGAASSSANTGRMPSFGTLQAESQALLGGPRAGATPVTHLGHSTNIESHAVEYIDPDEDEFPQRPIQRRSRGLMGSLHNVLGGRTRNRSNTGGGSLSSVGSPTIATVSSGSPTRASTSTPFSMLRGAVRENEVASPPDERYQQPSTSRKPQGSSSGPQRTASVGSAPWRRRRSGARDWDWSTDGAGPSRQTRRSHIGSNVGGGSDSIMSDSHLRAPEEGKHSSSSEDWRKSSPGAYTTGGGSIRDDASGNSEVGMDWDVESAVERRVVQVMFTVPRERLRVVNASDGDGGDERGITTGTVAIPADNASERSIGLRGGGVEDALHLNDADSITGGLARGPSKYKPGRGSPGLW